MNSPTPRPAAEASSRPRRQVWIVLPAFNEEASLPGLLDDIDESMFEAHLPYRIVLVDDGSRDATAEIAERYATSLPLTVERHEVNQGLGATIRDGLMKAAASAHPKDIIVTMDADRSHTPQLILRMVRLIREGHDTVIASRYRPGSRIQGVPWSRRFLSYWGSWLFRILFPTPGVRDYTCGFRAYRAGVLQEVIAEHGREFFDQTGFQCMVDILLKLRRRDLIFGEVPFVLRYDLKEGASKMNVGKTIRDTLTLIARRRLNP